MNPQGEYIIVAGEVLATGKIKVSYRKTEETGVFHLDMIHPPGSIVRIGETVEIEVFGFVPKPQ